MLRTYRRPLALVVATYVAVALLGRATPRGEIFPFFSWDLFSSVPAVHQVRTAVRILSVDGERLEEPVPLAGSRYLRGQPITVSGLARDLLEALARDPGAVAGLEQQLEDNHLPQTRLTWAVVQEHFDPLERFDTGQAEVTEVARFGAGGADPLEGFAIEDDELVTPTGRVPIRQGPVGFVEEMGFEGDGTTPEQGWFRLSGWAGDRVSGALPDQLVVVSRDRVVRLGGISVRRGAVADSTGHGRLGFSGFSLHVPAAAVEDPDGLRVLALFGDDAAVVVPAIDDGIDDDGTDDDGTDGDGDRG